METFDIVPESPIDKPYVETNYNGTLLLDETDYRIGIVPVNTIKCVKVVKKIVNDYTNIRVILPGNVAITAEKIGITLIDAREKKSTTIVTSIKNNHIAVKTETILWSDIPQIDETNRDKALEEFIRNNAPIINGRANITYPTWVDSGTTNTQRLGGAPYYRSEQITLGHINTSAMEATTNNLHISSSNTNKIGLAGEADV